MLSYGASLALPSCDAETQKADVQIRLSEQPRADFVIYLFPDSTS